MSAADWEAEITVTYRHSLAKRRKHDEDVIKRAMESGFPQHAAAGPKQHAEFDAWLASRQASLDSCEAQR